MHAKNFHVQGPQINQFNNIAPSKIPRSMFKRDYTYRTTFDSDYLIPIFIDEILPGDDVNIKMTAFTRMSTPQKPLMDNLYQETAWFFVPMRLVWQNWEKFQGQQTNPGDSVAYTIPKLDPTVAPISTTGFTVGSIYDYFGLPTGVTNLDKLSALFNRAYALTYNEWFRDENLQNSLTFSTGDGPDNPAFYTLQKRGKRKDYRTSCLPWPQKGDPVTIPIASGTYPVSVKTPLENMWVRKTSASLSEQIIGQTQVTDTALKIAGVMPGSDGPIFWGSDIDGNVPGIEVTIDNFDPISINALRQAALYQQILELDARGGTRYVESIYTRFGVISPDFRLQRPELIGQGSTRINIYAVPQTAPSTEASTPQGNLAAYGVNVINRDHGCRYSATEHGIILGIMNVRADLTYQQGIPKMFSRQTRLDFYEPLLNGLGEQAVLNKEIFAQGTSEDDDVFGYQERFAEYRYRDSQITGLFRSTAAQSLDVWHVSEEFADLPVLNGEFIQSNTPMDRVLAVPSEPDFLCDISFDYTHVRPMPIRSNPGIDKL